MKETIATFLWLFAKAATWTLLVLVGFMLIASVLYTAKAQGAYGSSRDPNRKADPGHAEYHQWYNTLYMKERGYQHIKCCDEKDCGPVKFLGWDTKGNPRLLTRYGIQTAPFDKIQIQKTPNQGWHACYLMHSEHGDSHITWYCVIAPEMAG